MESILKTYGVKGLHCAGCVSTVEKALSELEGVHNASVNLSLENVKLETESSIIFETLQDAVQNHGYTLIEENSEKYSERKEKEIHSLRKHLIYNGRCFFQDMNLLGIFDYARIVKGIRRLF